jgi:hypothetical protein
VSVASALLALLLATIGLAACAGTTRPHEEVREERAPILSLVEGGGILMADNRKFLFALYDDGTVIHATPRDTWPRDRHHANTPGYVRAKLTLEEKTKLLQRLRPEELQSVPDRFEHFCDWPSTIPAKTTCTDRGNGERECVTEGNNGSCWTDSATFSLVWRNGSQATTIFLIGGLDGGPTDDRSEAPAALLRIWDTLTTDEGDGLSWTPDRELLEFRSREGVKDTPRRSACPWPSEFGGEHPGTEEFRDGNLCRVLPAAVREPARDWIQRCHGFARLRADWYVDVFVHDLLPGEPPGDAAKACR